MIITNSKYVTEQRYKKDSINVLFTKKIRTFAFLFASIDKDFDTFFI